MLAPMHALEIQIIFVMATFHYSDRPPKFEVFLIIEKLEQATMHVGEQITRF